MGVFKSDGSSTDMATSCPLKRITKFIAWLDGRFREGFASFGALGLSTIGSHAAGPPSVLVYKGGPPPPMLLGSTTSLHPTILLVLASAAYSLHKAASSSTIQSATVNYLGKGRIISLSGSFGFSGARDASPIPLSACA